MKKLYFLLITLIFMSVELTSCSSNQNNNKPGSQVVVNESQPNIGENLNLKGVGEIVRNSRNP